MLFVIITLFNHDLRDNWYFCLRTAKEMKKSVNPWRLFRGLRALSRGLPGLRTAGASEMFGQHYLGNQSQ